MRKGKVDLISSGVNVGKSLMSENLINWKMFVDKRTDLCYIQNIADEWWEWSDHYDEWQEVSWRLPSDKKNLVEIKEFIAEDDAYTWYPPSWIEND